ncbi:MAG: TAXI family TRAP transporter solute-binding subunit [Chloroflexi bacterium]|nr:TAXI family TRAP transporter solute-binding subunit [Chloroflexota bacterium]
MKNGRKINQVCIVGLILGAVLVSACAQPAQQTPGASTTSGAPAAAKKPDFFTVIGGPGLAQPVGAALAKKVEAKTGVPGTFAEPPGGSVGIAYVKQLAERKADVALSGGDLLARQAFLGTGPFQGQGQQPVRGLMVSYGLGVTFMTRADSGIKSIPDMRGKRIMSWLPAVPQFGETLDALFKFHKMTKNDVVAIKQSSIDEANDALKARTVDVSTRAFPQTGSVGIEELAREIDLVLIPITQAEVDFVRKESEYISGGVTIKAGTIKGQDKDVLMAAYQHAIVAHRDLPDDFVYVLMELLLEGAGPDTPGAFTQVHPGADWTLNRALAVTDIVALHPGAVRYYKDKGVWTAQHEEKQNAFLKMLK